jgi:hypothetical protein
MDATKGDDVTQIVYTLLHSGHVYQIDVFYEHSSP